MTNVLYQAISPLELIRIIIKITKFRETHLLTNKLFEPKVYDLESSRSLHTCLDHKWLANKLTIYNGIYVIIITQALKNQALTFLSTGDPLSNF